MQAHTLRHERVHAYLSVADDAAAATFRQNVGLGAYKRSAFFNALEETLAEGIASRSLSAGLGHAFNGAYKVKRFGRVSVVTPWNAGGEAAAGLIGYGGLLWGTYEFGNWLWGNE